MMPVERIPTERLAAGDPERVVVLSGLMQQSCNKAIKHIRKLFDIAVDAETRATSAEAEVARLRDALEKIAEEQNVYRGHGDFEVMPMLTADEAQDIARKALTHKEPSK